MFRYCWKKITDREDNNISINMTRTTLTASTTPNPSRSDKLLEELTTQMLLMQRTIKTMADELTELRKITLEVKEGQNQIVTAIGGLKGGSVPMLNWQNNKPVEPVAPSVDTTSNVVNIKPASASFNFGKVFPSTFEQPKPVQPVSFFNPPAQKIEFPTTELALRLDQFPLIGVEKALQSVKDLNNWREDMLNKANICCLMNAAKKQTIHSEKDLFVSFLDEQSQSVDLVKSDTWIYRLEIIVDALCSAPDSILFQKYKEPISEYVNLWKNEVQNDFEAIKVIVNGLFTVFSKSSNEGAFIDAIEIMVNISETLSVEQRNAIGTSEFMKILLNLMPIFAHPKFITQAWRFLWNITDESASNSVNFCNAGGLNTFEKLYERYRNNGSFSELLLNMFGTLGNLVEVEMVRTFMWKPSYTNILRNVLETQDIELRVFAGGIIAELVSDGESSSGYHACTQVLLEVVPTWSSAVPLSVNYSSLHPVYRLLTSPAASQLYSSWFLANLLVINKPKYMPMLKEDNIEPILRDICSNPETSPLTKELAGNVLNQIQT